MAAKLTITTLIACGALWLASPAHALDIGATPAMQSCQSDADCMVVDAQCGNACSVLPINSQYAGAIAQQKLAQCGAGANSENACVTRPAMTSACVNARCTVGVAWQENASAADYTNSLVRGKKGKRGATAEDMANIAPAAGMEAKKSQSQHHSNGKESFSAYDLPDRGNGTTQVLGRIADKK